MGFCTNHLSLDTRHPKVGLYEIVVETGTDGLVHLLVACKPRSQGADLTAAECRALAQMLLSAAELAEYDLRTST